MSAPVDSFWRLVSLSSLSIRSVRCQAELVVNNAGDEDADLVKAVHIVISVIWV